MKHENKILFNVNTADVGQPKDVELQVDSNGILLVSGIELHPTDKPNVFRAKQHGADVPVYIEFDGVSKVEVSLRGYTYICAVHTDVQHKLLQILSSSPSASNRVSRIVSPMPGLLKYVYASVGDNVKKGTTLFVLEAMKMENAIKAPVTGVVSEMHVVEGDAHEKGALLCTIQPHVD